MNDEKATIFNTLADAMEGADTTDTRNPFTVTGFMYVRAEESKNRKNNGQGGSGGGGKGGEEGTGGKSEERKPSEEDEVSLLSRYEYQTNE